MSGLERLLRGPNLTLPVLVWPRTQLSLPSGGGTSCSLGIDFTPQSSRAGGAAAKIRAEGDGAGNAGLSLWTATGGSAAAAVERVRIGTDGNVGIGFTQPKEKLHLNGNLSLIYPSSILTTTIYGDLFSSPGTSKLIDVGWSLNGLSGDVVSIYTPGASSLSPKLSLSSGGVIHLNGNIGIGTTQPTAPMHLQGNAYISGSLSAGNMGMFRNKIINGDMRVNQRGITTANPETTNGSFSVDRFRVNIGGAVTSWSHGQYTLSSTTDATVYNQGFRYALQVNRGSGGTAVDLRQYFELSMIEDLYNAPVCISFWAKSSIAGSINVSFVKTPDGTTAGTVIGYGRSLTTNWSYYTVIISQAIPPTSSTGSTTGYGGEVLFSLQNLPNTSVFQLTGVQVERGTLATPFEFRPLGIELSLCQRYYWKTNITNFALAVNRLNGYKSIFLTLPTTMRAIPNITYTISQGTAYYNETTPNVFNLWFSGCDDSGHTYLSNPIFNAELP